MFIRYLLDANLVHKFPPEIKNQHFNFSKKLLYVYKTNKYILSVNMLKKKNKNTITSVEMCACRS